MYQLLRAIYMFCKLLLLVLVLLFLLLLLLLLLLHQQVHLSGSQLLPKPIMGFSLPCIMSISQQLGLISKIPKKSNYKPSLFKTQFLVRKSYIPASQAEPITTYQIQTPQPHPQILILLHLHLVLLSSCSCSSAFLSCWFDLCSIHEARTSSSSSSSSPSSSINPNVFFITFPTLDFVDEFPLHLQESLETHTRETHKQQKQKQKTKCIPLLSFFNGIFLGFLGVNMSNFWRIIEFWLKISWINLIHVKRRVRPYGRRWRAFYPLDIGFLWMFSFFSFLDWFLKLNLTPFLVVHILFF